MNARIDHGKYLQSGMVRAMLSLSGEVARNIEPPLFELVKIRASQINGCAYCIDMHWKDLRAAGESEQRLYSLDAWGECPYYTPRERAALLWTEAVTEIADGHAADEVYEEVRPHFTPKELCDLTLAVATINAWNRISIAGRLVPGNYRPAAVASPPATEATK